MFFPINLSEMRPNKCLFYRLNNLFYSEIVTHGHRLFLLWLCVFDVFVQ